MAAIGVLTRFEVDSRASSEPISSSFAQPIRRWSVMDFRKFLFERKEVACAKRSRRTPVKEIKFRPLRMRTLPINC